MLSVPRYGRSASRSTYSTSTSGKCSLHELDSSRSERAVPVVMLKISLRAAGWLIAR